MLPLLLPERIETERLLLRRLRYEDAEEIFYVYASKPEATKFVTWCTHNSIQETRRFLDYAMAAWNNGTEYSFTIRVKETGLLIGSFGVTNDSGKVSFGYIFGPNHWRQGYATEACKAMLRLLINQPGVYRIWTLVAVGNVASSKVLQKCGLIEEARLKKWFRFINQDNEPRDCILYRLPFDGE
jgi:RimJ/RimL family protein N-acetyltransferase